MSVAGVMFAASLVAMAAAEPNSTTKVGPNVITQPDWLQKPDGEALAEQYPKLAAALGVEGYAVVSCTVTAAGLLADCNASTERPAGLGFGQAAVALGGLFRMKPMTLNGRPVDGGKINIPIRFQLPVTDAHEPPAPISDEAAKQALRLIDSGKVLDRALEGYEAWAKTLETIDPTVSPSIARDGAETIRRAAQLRRDDLRTALARAFASVFSEGELSAMADFHGSSAGRSLGDTAYVSGQDLILKEYVRNLAADARRGFCAKIACDVASDVRRVWRAADAKDAGRIDAPVWDAQPSPSQAWEMQPKLGGLLGLTAVVRMTCRVGDKGLLRDCAVDEEGPAGLGYGASALKLAAGYQLSAILVESGAVGRRVTVRVGFEPAPPPEPYRPPHGDARTLSLARQLAQLQGPDAQWQLQNELQITDMATNPPKGADDKVYEAALDAYRVGIKQALAAYIEQSADNLSSAFTEAQLQALIAYRSSPAGKAERDRAKELDLAFANAQAWAQEKLTVEARTLFCAAHDCAAKPAVQGSGASSAPSTRTP